MSICDLLAEEELITTEGGQNPFYLALGLGTLFVGAVKLGYDFGKDLANRAKRNQNGNNFPLLKAWYLLITSNTPAVPDTKPADN